MLISFLILSAIDKETGKEVFRKGAMVVIVIVSIIPVWTLPVSRVS